MDRRRVVNNLCSHIGASSLRLKGVLLTQANSSPVAAYPALKTKLESVAATLQSQIDAMEAYVKIDDRTATLDLSQTSYDDALGQATGLITQIGVTTPVSKMIRDAYSGISLIALGFERLYAIGVGIADTNLQTLSLDSLEDLTPVIKSLSESICSVYAEELHDEDPTIDAATTAAAAISATQGAWNSSS